MADQTQYHLISCDENSQLVTETSRRIGQEWPEFMLHDPTADLMDHLYTEFPKYQFVLIDRLTNQVAAIGNSIPVSFNGIIDDLPEQGWDWAIQKGFEDLKSGATPNLLCALQIVVFSESRGKGISSLAVQGMKSLGQSNSLCDLIAPVRPNRKSEYPLISIDDYVRWKLPDGRPFDPWLRVHSNGGARLVKPCHKAMEIPGTIAEWEEWTGLKFLQSGDYVVPGALVPISVDLEKDRAVYTEPNVWMHHPPDTK